MIYLTVLIIVISFFEIRWMYKKKQKKEIVMYAFLALFAFGLGWLYASNPNRPSLANVMLTLFGYID